MRILSILCLAVLLHACSSTHPSIFGDGGGWPDQWDAAGSDAAAGDSTDVGIGAGTDLPVGDSLPAPDADADPYVTGDSALGDLSDPGSEDAVSDAAGIADLETSLPDAVVFQPLPCQKHQDCIGIGLCLMDFAGEKLCLPWCETSKDCALGMKCMVPNGYDDAVCVAVHPNLCKPCMEDEDCLPKAYAADVACVGFQGQGKFCACACAEKFPYCPDGYTCTAVVDSGGTPAERCLRTGGASCNCEPYMEGAVTSCFVQGEGVTCEGTLSCSGGKLSACSAKPPSAEQCDGADNDCDGEVDEGIAGGPECVIDYDSGTCDAPMECMAGEWVCPFVDFSNVCSAPGLACTWQEPVSDTDLDGDPDSCDSDDDDDGFPDAEDCLPEDPLSFPGADEKCDGADNDCDGVKDYKQLQPVPCTVDSQWGECSASAWCIDGQWECATAPPGPDHCPEAGEDCLFYPMPEAQDYDKDGSPNFCDPDKDGDGVANEKDNCPDLANISQADVDKDGQGDLCDVDDDNDTVPDWKDCCPFQPNPDQKDTDGDKACDACESDDDNDLVPDVKDNCPLTKNADQKDSDGDGIGDACE